MTTAEIQDCIDQLTGQDLKDIEFAQTQVRNFAQIQRDSMKDVEVETLLGANMELDLVMPAKRMTQFDSVNTVV